MIRGIKFVSVPVANQDVALAFFTEKLGFKVATDQPFDGKQRWIELMIPGAETGLVLFTPEGHEERIGGFQPLSFQCDDAMATGAVLKARAWSLCRSRRGSTGGRRRFSRMWMGTSMC